MQNRMKTHQLTEAEINSLLETELVGHLATVRKDRPYVVPVHYIYQNGKIYIHGLMKGQKLKNIAKNKNVCFEVSRFEKLIMPEEDSPCNVNTQYQSVVVAGTAKITRNKKIRTDVLNKIVQKYAPALSEKEFGNPIKAVAVIQIKIREITGKYYP